MKPSFDVDGDAPPQMNWRSLFASEEDQSLHFFPPHFGSLQRLIKQIWGRCGEIAIHPTIVAPPPSAVDIASCSHVFASNVNEVVAIGTSLPIEVVGCESGLIDVVSIDLVVGIVDGNVEFGSIDIVSTELAAGNVVAGNVSNVLVNVELVVGAVEAYIALSVDVSYVMPDQSIHALPVASTKGQSLHTYDQIVEEDVGFFTKLLGVSNPNVSGCSVELLQDRLCSSFSDEACNAFQSEISREEIKIALFEQKSDKVPGADGFSA
ncbi:hypothetical protein V6N11_025288 [Hibiscus sabdariffa]|uniref:Uncharacterized protein n=1 Tax=Hibiscus sabdariffa TaxID=183260 RepID=A0ABR2QPM1_9ROSI